MNDSIFLKSIIKKTGYITDLLNNYYIKKDNDLTESANIVDHFIHSNKIITEKLKITSEEYSSLLNKYNKEKDLITDNAIRFNDILKNEKTKHNNELELMEEEHKKKIKELNKIIEDLKKSNKSNKSIKSIKSNKSINIKIPNDILIEKDNLIDKNKIYKETIASLESRIISLKTTIDLKNDEILQIKKDKLFINQRLTDLEKYNEELLSKDKIISSKIKELEDNNEQLIIQIDELENNNNELIKQIDVINTKFISLNAQNEENAKHEKHEEKHEEKIKSDKCLLEENIYLKELINDYKKINCSISSKKMIGDIFNKYIKLNEDLKENFDSINLTLEKSLIENDLLIKNINYYYDIYMYYYMLSVNYFNELTFIKSSINTNFYNSSFNKLKK